MPRLVVSKPYAWTPSVKKRKYTHRCCAPGCDRVIEWQLAYCVDCVWGDLPFENVKWPIPLRVAS